MIKLIFMVLVSGLLLTACVHQREKDKYTRIVFDSGNLKFVASSLNQTNETMSALYGNYEAYTSLSGRDSIPAAGSILKLVTWRYHDNPGYFGGKINGELLSVETVTADEDGRVIYHQVNSSNNWNQPNQQNQQPSVRQQKRIAYLMGYQPVAFP